MTTEDNKPLVDASIISPFGGQLAPVGGIAPSDGLDLPDYLKRTEQTDVTVGVADGAVAHAGSDDGVAADHSAGSVGVVDGAETTTAAVDHDHVAGEGAPLAPLATEVTDAGVQTTLITPEDDAANVEHADNPRAVMGDNQEPMSRDEMIKEFNKDVASYGKDSGKGAAALPRLGLRVIRAAADGLISSDKPKDGTDSDAVRIYKRYAEQDSKHAEHTKGGMKANAAKLNALIGLGSMTTVDGVDVAARTVALREKMEGAEQKPKALFAGLVDVARAQMDSDTPLTDDAIETALGKVAKDKTVAEEWNAIYKKIEKLVSGENPQGLKDQSDTALAIAKQVQEHINNFASNGEREERIAWCMEKGMTRAQAEEFASK